ncbi:MAG TPA: hypothetical protein VMU14_04870 [Acidimicrobiales bacterium]|nr:hypothetical protein [Acidimicrobiales bacterium]
MTRKAGLLAWTATLAAAAWLLARIGHGALGAPPAVSVAALRSWASARDAATIVMCVLRLLSLVLDGYLLMTTVAGALARAARWTAAVRVLDAVTPSSVRRVLAASVGGIVLSAPFLAPAPWPVPVAGAVNGPPLTQDRAGVVLAPATDGPPLVRLSPPRDRGPLTAQGTGPLRGGTPDATVAPQRRAPTTNVTATGPHAQATASPTAPPTTMPPPTPTATPAAQLWTVQPAENFWAIARRIVASRTGVAAPMPSAIAPFWAALIAANRDRLRDPRDPSLVYAGERFVIPAR